MTTYYVSSLSGNDSNAGTSASAPLATLQDAANIVRAGDTVEVMNGTYTTSYAGVALNISASGTAGAPITFEAAPGATPVINSSGGWFGINIQGSYVTVKGFTVVGDAANYNLSSAMAAYSTSDSNVDGNGIAVNPANDGSMAHNVIIENNTVYNEPGGGINTEGADYVQVLNNTVYNNANWSAYGNSGISISTSENYDNASGAHIIVSGNLVYDNAQLVPTFTGGGITDGEGIILDTNPDYTAEMLVENNTIYGSGGPGIVSFLTNNAVITGNTVYDNNTVQGSGSGIAVVQSSNNTVSGNFFTASSSSSTSTSGSTTSSTTTQPTTSGATTSTTSNPATAASTTSPTSSSSTNTSVQASAVAAPAATTTTNATTDATSTPATTTSSTAATSNTTPAVFATPATTSSGASTQSTSSSTSDPFSRSIFSSSTGSSTHSTSLGWNDLFSQSSSSNNNSSPFQNFFAAWGNGSTTNGGFSSSGNGLAEILSSMHSGNSGVLGNGFAFGGGSTSFGFGRFLSASSTTSSKTSSLLSDLRAA